MQARSAAQRRVLLGSLAAAAAMMIIERLIVVRVQLQAPTMDDANQAFVDLVSRVEHSVPKRRFARCMIMARKVTLGALNGGERRWGAAGRSRARRGVTVASVGPTC